MFWGLNMKPTFVYKQQVKTSFHISGACLGLGKEASLILLYNNELFTLAHLDENVKQVSLDLNFEAGQMYELQTKGDATVSLTGFVIGMPENANANASDSDFEETVKLLAAILQKGSKAVKFLNSNFTETEEIEDEEEDDEDDEEEEEKDDDNKDEGEKKDDEAEEAKKDKKNEAPEVEKKQQTAEHNNSKEGQVKLIPSEKLNEPNAELKVLDLLAKKKPSGKQNNPKIALKVRNFLAKKKAIKQQLQQNSNDGFVIKKSKKQQQQKFKNSFAKKMDKQ